MWLCGRVLWLLLMRNKAIFLPGKASQFLWGDASVQLRAYALQVQAAPPGERRSVTQARPSWCLCLRVNDQLYHSHVTKFSPIRSQSETFTVVIGEKASLLQHRLKGSNVNLKLSCELCEPLSDRAYSTVGKKKKSKVMKKIQPNLNNLVGAPGYHHA